MSIEHLRDGELVSATTIGRPDRELERRVVDLDDTLAGLLAGRALLLSGQPCSTSVLVGMPVYWHADNLRYEPAVAATVFDSVTRVIVSAPSAEVIGVVVAKPGAATADIVLTGVTPINLTAAGVSTALPGRYYLSATTPGYLVRQRQSPTVPVLTVLGSGQCLVRPQAREWGLDHEHHSLELVCRPAGDHVDPGVGRHTVTDADPALAGWLPAAHASFNSRAPANAKFGYNLAADPAALALWPPMPIEAASLNWDRGELLAGGTEIPLGIDGLAVIDRYGIWWMSDCAGDVPWPADYTFSNGTSANYPAPTTSECPRQENMRLRLSLSRTPYDATRLAVTSLRAAPNSVITVQACAGGAATTGDLEIDANLTLAVSSMNTAGHLALKGVNQQQQLIGGPILEGLIVATNGNLTASSTHPQVLTGGTVLHQGRITLAAVIDPADRELLGYVLRLLEAKERYVGGVNYVALPPGQRSGLVQQFRVPLDGIQASASLTFRMTCIGTLAGALPALQYAWRRIPVGSGTPAALPTSDTTLLAATPPTLTTGNQYVQLTLPAVTVQPGDTVLLTITRPGTDGYGGEVGFLHTVAAVA